MNEVKMRRLIVTFPLFFICLYGFSENKKSLEEDIKEVMGDYQAVGVSVAVIKDNKIVYTNSFGYNPDYNDTTLRKSIPINGKYVIQSISKSFIATAIMQLVERKKLKLDDDANKYLDFNLRNPKFPKIPITIRMLLCQRSSINDKHYGWTFDQIKPTKGKKWQECYNEYKPGTKFSYCNLNYNLLGAIIENVTGKRFFDYIDENITDPLSINASFNLTKMDSTLIVKALKYDKKLKSFKQENSIYSYEYYRNKLKNYKLGNTTPCFSPSGGMKISVEDLAKYMMMHMNYGEFNGIKIISKESELEMWTPQGPDNGDNSFFQDYGLSFSRFNNVVEGESFVGVTGGAHGISSNIYFNPEKKYGFAVICNGSITGMKLNNSIVRILYKSLIN